MKASEVLERVWGELEKGAIATATAIIEQAKAVWIADDRRGRTFSTTELAKARAAGIAEGREQAAVIVDGFAFCGHIAAAIRKGPDQCQT